MDDTDDIASIGTRELRTELGRRIDAAHFLHEPTIITYNGEPRAVLIGYSDWLAYRKEG